MEARLQNNQFRQFLEPSSVFFLQTIRQKESQHSHMQIISIIITKYLQQWTKQLRITDKHNLGRKNISQKWLFLKKKINFHYFFFVPRCPKLFWIFSQVNLCFFVHCYNSPPNIIFLTSGILWICLLLWRFFINHKSNHDQNKSKLIQRKSQFYQQQLENLYIHQKEILVNKKQNDKNSLQKNEQITIQNLPYVQIVKIVIPKFLQILCFFYGVTYLSFPRIIIFSILTKVGLFTFYKIVFTDNQKKRVKIVINLLTCFGFGLFNFSFTDNSGISKQKNPNQKEIIYGYMFAVMMCYLGVMKIILQNNVHTKYPNLSSLDLNLLHAKTNCILAYLLSVYLKEQIYGPVFAVIHSQFVWNVIAFSVVLLTGLLMKQYIKKINPEIKNFVLILQKNMSLVLSLILFQHEINLSQILAISIIVSMTFIDFLFKLISSDQNDETSQISKEVKHPSCKDQDILLKNDYTHDQGQNKSFEI